jgi:hypothetical protein
MITSSSLHLYNHCNRHHPPAAAKQAYTSSPWPSVPPPALATDWLVRRPPPLRFQEEETLGERHIWVWMVEREALDVREFHERRIQGLRLQERGGICDWNDENEGKQMFVRSGLEKPTECVQQKSI